MKETMKFQGLAATTEGVSAQGNPWRKTYAIFETIGDHPRTIAVMCFNDMCQRAAELVKGGVYEVNADITSREFNGKWYTDVKAWGIYDPKQWDNTPPPIQPNEEPKTQPGKAVQTSIDTMPPIGTSSDDLPF